MPDSSPAVIADTTHSSHARLRPVPVPAVTLRDSFWAPRRLINRENTLPSQYRHCEETGRFNNFRRAAGKRDVPFEGIYFNDSDIYKWLEAAAFALATDPDDEALRGMVGAAIAEVAPAQDADGYLNTYFSVDKVGERWTNLRDMHELYCAGHLIQAAVAHHRATGETSLLDIATRFADHLCDTFGPEGRAGACGHEEVEMALVELYRETSRGRYLAQAQRFIDLRGRTPTALYKPDGDPNAKSAYHQDHVPFRELGEVTGHAVRMMYLDCGAADVYLETGEAALKDAMDRQWENMTQRRMYVTGGIGSRWEGEAFGKDYELPSDRAYTETCAAIGSVMWNWRLLLATGEARYADLMELTLYNGMLPGLSLDGQQYFYQNPLEDDGAHRRQPWFGCACCPPNVARTLAALPGYFTSISDSAVWLHLYAAGEATLTLPDGGCVALTQTTNYPWDGDIAVMVTDAPTAEVTLHLRVPAWAEGAAVTVNDEPSAPAAPGDFAAVKRAWKAGDTVRLSLPIAVRQIVSHPYAADPAGRVALMRGPLVYCVEQADNPNADVRDIVIPADAEIGHQFQSDLLGGVVTLSFTGAQAAPPPQALYQPRGAQTASTTPVAVTAIPYYAWANREAGPMRVWLRTV